MYSNQQSSVILAVRNIQTHIKNYNLYEMKCNESTKQEKERWKQKMACQCQLITDEVDDLLLQNSIMPFQQQLGKAEEQKFLQIQYKFAQVRSNLGVSRLNSSKFSENRSQGSQTSKSYIQESAVQQVYELSGATQNSGALQSITELDHLQVLQSKLREIQNHKTKVSSATQEQKLDSKFLSQQLQSLASGKIATTAESQNNDNCSRVQYLEAQLTVQKQINTDQNNKFRDQEAEIRLLKQQNYALQGDIEAMAQQQLSKVQEQSYLQQIQLLENKATNMKQHYNEQTAELLKSFQLTNAKQKKLQEMQNELILEQEQRLQQFATTYDL